MRKYQDPTSFIEVKLLNNKYTLRYLNLNEISQGSPLIGLLSINDRVIDRKKFGGPFLYEKNTIYIPCYTKTFFKSGFRLCKINLETLNITNIDNKIFDIIDLIEIKDKKIFFYKSLFDNEIVSIILI